MVGGDEGEDGVVIRDERVRRKAVLRLMGFCRTVMGSG